MKRIYTYMLVVLIACLVPSYSFAASCNIKNAPSPVLIDYLDNLHTVVKNITSELSEKERDNGALSEIQENLQRGYNKLINWDGYYSSFNYYVTLELTHEIPREIRRDGRLIETEIDGLTKYYKKLIKQGHADTIVQGVCTTDMPNCNLGGAADDIVLQLIQNTHAMSDYYRLSILGETGNFDKTLILVPQDFKGKFNQDYNQDTLSDCSSEEGGFFNRVSIAIKKLTQSDANWKKGFKTWQEALALAKDLNTLDGTESEAYKEREKAVLTQELRRQGLNTNASTAILNNLENYNNNGGFSLNNNPLVNSFNYTKKQIEKQLTNFLDSTGLRGGSDTGGSTAKDEKVSLKDVVNRSKIQRDTFEIQNEIRKIYTKEIPGASQVDNEAQKIQSRIVKLHLNMVNASKTLKDACKVSEKVCMQQASNYGGNCKCDL